MKNTKAIIETLRLDDAALDKKVKIQGTMYDRKRTIAPEVVRKMGRMVKLGKKTTYEIARELGVSPTAVRYNTDPIFKAVHNATRSGKHTGRDKVSVKNRVNYKRSLVADGLLAV